MALELSHIRFALDLKEKMRVVDLKEYVSGSVYPDSRFVTGIDRKLSHPLSDDFEHGDSDFRKGWYTHLALDLIQGNIFTGILGIPFSSIETGNDTWVAFSAAKMIQDMNDFEKIDFDALKKDLVVVGLPNQESKKGVQNFYDLILGTYSKKDRMEVDDYRKFWMRLGNEEELCERLSKKCIELQGDKEIADKIRGVHDRILSELEEVELRDLVREYKAGIRK
jgi:hypothetical protein